MTNKASLAVALSEFGKWDDGKSALIELLRKLESQIPGATAVDIRESVTGPIVDAMVGHGALVSKKLSSGLTISARYTSKIIRDFVMAGPNPDHVWEPQTTRTLLALTKNAEHVLIGGAYIGDHAILVADQLRERGTVHCFELSDQNISLLRTNAEQNNLSNLVVNQIALWSKPGRIGLVGEDAYATPYVAQEDDRDAFLATSIDEYAKSQGIKRLDFIMLDIEGGELEALKGAASFLSASDAPIVIYESNSAHTDWSMGFAQADINLFMLSRGYSIFAIRDYHSNVPMAGTPVELVEIDDVYVAGPKHGFNMLATKKPEQLGTLFKRVRSVSPKLLKHRDPALHAPLS